MQIIAIVVSLALTAAALALLVPAVRKMLAVIRSGQPAPGRSDNPGGRAVTMLKETFLHTRMLQWHWVGIMHWFVYMAFLFLSTAVLAAYFQLFKPDFAWPLIGHWYPYEWFSELIGLLSTVGIVFLIIYRQKHHPRSEGRNSRFFGSTMWQAYFVEALALLEGAAILFVRAAEWKLDTEAGRSHYPISSWIGDAIYPTSVVSLENLIYFIAMFKIALAMVWLMVIARNITMGIAWHRFTAWFNIFYKRESDGSTALGAMKPLMSDGKPVTLDDIDDLDEDSTLGVGQVEDFSWKGILDFTTCTECGRCQSQCPAWNTEKPLSPKLMIMALRDHAYEKAGAKTAPGSGTSDTGDSAVAVAEKSLVGSGSEDDWFYNPEGADFVIDEDVLWSCTSCGACVQQCPVDIEHVDHIMDMRRYQVLVESNFPSELNQLFKGLENKGNPWNMSPNARMDWAKGLEFDVPVVGETIESLDEVDWLFWVGCAGAYEDRAKKTTRAVAELLDMAGVSFGVLGNGETCTGDPARRAGNEFVFQGLAMQNVETFKEYKVKKVVSTCAHCFNTLKNEYKDFGIELEVVHHTQLLNRLVRDGKLTPVTDGAGAAKRSITYHDPCYLGRHNEVYSPPRELLQVLPGAEYAEMERNSEKSFCCGAGGARMWMEENIGERINVNRTKEAVGTGADQIAVGCPFCRVMLSDGLTAEQAQGNAREEVEVLDVAQMLLASVKGEQATKAAPGSSAKAGTPTAAGAAAATGAATAVATKDEPEAGDVTVTEDTVTDTADAGPAAKASGGSSLFDVDESTDSSGESDSTSAPSGGSLFDMGGGEEAAAPAAPSGDSATVPDAVAEAPTPTGSDEDLGSGGSLFDVSAEEPAPEAAAKAEAADEPVDRDADAAAETDADATPADAPTPAGPQDDLGSGGSLFDISADEPAPEAAAKAEAADEPVDRDADAAAETDADATPTDAGSDPAEADAATAADASPNEADEVTAAEETAPASSASAPSSTGATPATAIPEEGSLFDIATPEPASPAVAEPTTEPEPVDVPAADEEVATPESSEESRPTEGLAGGAALSQAATQAAGDDEATGSEAEAAPAEPEAADPASGDAPEATETEAQPAKETETVPEEPRQTSGGAAHSPRTDADIEGGSLFDL